MKSRFAQSHVYTKALVWRRGGDSNPRHPFGVKLISSQPCSATPAPLHGKKSAEIMVRMPAATKYSTERLVETTATRTQFLHAFQYGESCPVAARFSRVACRTPLLS